MLEFCLWNYICICHIDSRKEKLKSQMLFNGRLKPLAATFYFDRRISRNNFCARFFHKQNKVERYFLSYRFRYSLHSLLVRSFIVCSQIIYSPNAQFEYSSETTLTNMLCAAQAHVASTIHLIIQNLYCHFTSDEYSKKMR